MDTSGVYSDSPLERAGWPEVEPVQADWLRKPHGITIAATHRDGDLPSLAVKYAP